MIEPKKRSFQRIPFWELRGEFHSQGWFDQDIADAIGMTPGTLSTRMQGRSVWRADEISKICELRMDGINLLYCRLTRCRAQLLGLVGEEERYRNDV